MARSLLLHTGPHTAIAHHVQRQKDLQAEVLLRPKGVKLGCRARSLRVYDLATWNLTLMYEKVKDDIIILPVKLL